MKVIRAELSEREVRRRKALLAERREAAPEPKRHGKAEVRFLGKLGDYTQVKLKGLRSTLAGKTRRRCPRCSWKRGMTLWRRYDRTVALCPRCGWSG